MFKIELQLASGTWTDAADWLGHGLTQDMNKWDTHREATAVCEDLAAVGFDPDRLRVVEIVAPTAKDKLANAPEIELADKEVWIKWKDNNSDFYGRRTSSFAERWARMMQVELANGKNLQDIAEDTSSEADTEGITQYMYGAAVNILSKCWVHGETLRRWHNSKMQIGDEGERANESGGVLNPATFSGQL